MRDGSMPLRCSQDQVWVKQECPRSFQKAVVAVFGQASPTSEELWLIDFRGVRPERLRLQSHLSYTKAHFSR